MTRTTRTAIGACGALAFTLLASSGARAQTTFEGFTDACVGSATCTPTANSSIQTTSMVTSDGKTLITYTDAVFRALATTPGVPVQVSLGTFSLNSIPNTFGSWSFGLQATFTSPTNHTEIFRTTLTGAVFIPYANSAQVDFDNTPRTFGSQGQYTLHVEDLYLGQGELNGVRYDNPTQNVMLKGYVTASTVTPEPVSLALLGTGLAGLGAVRRRRQQQQREA